MGLKNEQRINAITQKMGLTGGKFMFGEERTQEFIRKTEEHHKEQMKHLEAEEERKKREKQLKEKETKAYLDKQVAAKHERKLQDKAFEQRQA